MKHSAILGAAVISMTLANSAFADDESNISFGPYVRAELGGFSADYPEAYWLPPGTSDPQVFFDLASDEGLMGSLAFGFDRMDGWRYDLSITYFGLADAAGPWSYTVPETEGPHADIATTIQSTAIMANVFYSPLQAQKNYSRFQPFVTAGIGVANNEVGEWTRTRTDLPTDSTEPRYERTFDGASTSSFAWAIGAGFAWNTGEWRGRPVFIEGTYRYYDLGTAMGSTVALPSDGHGEPREPLTFKNTRQTVTIGVRIPLRSY